ncbi:hypothetical protein GN244_ATG04422 [Phytophthora infestans]|uniref:Uncharacterized protein n=1 Tax=Phytophthora infestans TaxID=4787 RepID=A0A833THA3_PHYIN|nr:hypothetical protein GN244_ATG04422 [Phytophthora infestans]
MLILTYLKREDKVEGESISLKRYFQHLLLEKLLKLFLDFLGEVVERDILQPPDELIQQVFRVSKQAKLTGGEWK